MAGIDIVNGVQISPPTAGPEKSVWAQVVDKHKIEFFSRTGPRARYTVVFQTDSGKKLSFYVSEFSFGGYRRGETGTLKYRGDRIIDFH